MCYVKRVVIFSVRKKQLYHIQLTLSRNCSNQTWELSDSLHSLFPHRVRDYNTPRLPCQGPTCVFPRSIVLLLLLAPPIGTEILARLA